ncbi:MAG: ABC transporter ATP-binding protein [Oscillospiraceae bacterium]
MMRGGEKPKDLKGTIKKLAQYIGKYKVGVAFVLILSAASSLFSLVGPKLLGQGTDVLYEAVEKSFSIGKIVIDYDKLWGIIILMAALYIISFLFSLTQGFMMAKISNKVTYNLRNDVSLKINKLPLHYFDTTSKGDVLSRITNDVDTINQSLNESMTRLAAAITLIIGTMYMMLSISVVLTLISFLVIPASLFLIKKIVKFSQPLFKKQQKSLGQLNGHIEEMLSAHLVVKSFNMEQQSLEQFEEYNEELCSSAWRSQFASHMMMPLTNMVSNLGYILVCIVGATLVNVGRLSVGSILSFIQYVRNFNQPIQQIANISTMLQSAVACSERVFEFLEQENEMADDAQVEKTQDIDGSVEFKNVTFGYDEDCTVINNFSLKVNQGEKIAIVGPTGAGKTTIVKLLMRYYEINSGEILIDGININRFARNDLRSLFGMVLQDTWLFKGSIKENIAYSNENATMDDIIKSAKIGQVHHFVKALPNGYDFELNEETSNISQGQKQLLTIARAFLQNPKILILDEATSSVDTRTEVQIQKAMENLMKNRTSFVIAHRLSTIRDADKILVMNEGKIVEVGNHEQLIAQNGFYAKLYQSQFENAIEE